MKQILIVLATIALMGCAENYSVGERIGFITQFSQTGLVWKSWEGHLNVTQTGMNTAVPWDFSLDNDHEPSALIPILDSAARFGWKVKLRYHNVFGLNWFSNRGHTDSFVTNCVIADRTPMQTLFGGKDVPSNPGVTGKVVDTIYVVIVKHTGCKQ